MSGPALPRVPVEQLERADHVAVGLMRRDGSLVRANDAFRDAWSRGREPPGSWAGFFIKPSFADIARRAQEVGRAPEMRLAFVEVLHVGPVDGVSRAMRTSVFTDGNLILLAAEPDVPAYERLSRETATLHEELAEAHRQQARDMRQLRETEAELRNALEQVRTLRGLLPVCAHCRRVRGDEGLWEQIESYVERHSLAEFSHGICERCMDSELASLAAQDAQDAQDAQEAQDARGPKDDAAPPA